MPLQHVRVIMMRWGEECGYLGLHFTQAVEIGSLVSPYQLLARAGLSARHYKCSRVRGPGHEGRNLHVLHGACINSPDNHLSCWGQLRHYRYNHTLYYGGAARSQHGNRLCGHSVAGASQAGHLVIWLQPTAGVKSPDWFNCSRAVLGRAGLGWAGLGSARLGWAGPGWARLG